MSGPIVGVWPLAELVDETCLNLDFGTYFANPYATGFSNQKRISKTDTILFDWEYVII